MRIWCNAAFNENATRRLRVGLAGHDLVVARGASAQPLAAGEPDPGLAAAEVAFGQPDPAQLTQCSALRWAHLTTAGYTRYDTAGVRAALGGRGVPLTTSSTVFADSCAQHVLAMMLALARQLPQSLRDQLGDRDWHYYERRYDSQLLTGQSAVILGFGAIGRRLVELLAPFRLHLVAFRRRPVGDEGVAVVDEAGLPAALGRADHVINLLPENDGSRRWCDAARFAQFKPGARFYNVGRGATVDQEALLAALRSGRLGAAYLDVTDPEPLPPDHPLWTAPGCFITPHTAGGRRDQDEATVAHFLENFGRFTRGEPLLDRVI